MDIHLPPLTEGSLYYTTDDVAAWLNLSSQTIRNHVRSGILQHHRFGKLIRISPDQLRAYVEAAFDKARKG